MPFRFFSYLPICFMAAIAMLPASGAYGQDQAAASDDGIVRFSQEVVVTPTRRDEPMAKVPAPVTVITADDIARSTARDIPEVLRSHAGIHVADITGNRRSYRVDLRGFGETASSNTLVLVDGRRVTLPDLSGTDWLQVSLDRVERIEVTKGSRGSVLYGDNATAGIINIITKDGRREERTVTVEGGSYGTFGLAASVEGSGDLVSYAIEASYDGSDGYRDNGDTDVRDVGGVLTFEPSPSFRLTLTGGLHADEAGLPGVLTESDLASGVSRRDTLRPDEFAEVDDTYIMVTPRLDLSDTSVVEADVSFRQRDTVFFSTFAGGSFDGNTDIGTISVSPRFVLTEPMGGLQNTLVTGFDFSRVTEDIVNTTVFSGVSSVGRFGLEKRNQGFYLHDELFLDPRAGLSGGYRYDHVEYTFSPSSPASTSFDEHLATVGLNCNLRGNSHLYLGFSQGFRYPLLDEVFNFFSNTIDATLRPQASDSYEAGIRHAFSDSAFGSFNYFHVDTDDEIFFNPTGGPFGFGANENLDGRTRRHGIEVSAGGAVNHVTVSGSYAYTHATILDGDFAGRRVPNVPRHRATVQTVIPVGEQVTLGVDGTYVGTRPFESDYQNTFRAQDAYVIVNLKVQYERGRFNAFADIRNLLDQEYAEYGVLGGFPVEPAFFPSPGLNVRVGTTIGF